MNTDEAIRVVGTILIEDYERSVITGDSSRLKRTLQGLKNARGLDAAGLARWLDAAVYHINLDGAEFIIDELGFNGEKP